MMLELQRPYPMPHATTFEPLEPTVLSDRPYKPVAFGAMNTTSSRPTQYWADNRAVNYRNPYHTLSDTSSNPVSGNNDWTSRSNQPARVDSAWNVEKTLQNSHTHGGATTQEAEEFSPEVDAALPIDLKVPLNVSTPQVSIARLAAEVTCLFWFENGNVLKQIENMSNPPSTPVNYVPDAKPTPAFKKWISSLLATTQVKPNVVLLALLFIYRLKCANPNVKGRPGSEYRLLTVALMLGNKFLDDNTYTNKTWADVSAISAQEVHIMEVEFLSNMRYTLYVSEAQWKKWYLTLGKFGTYISKSIRHWDSMASQSATIQPVPTLQSPGLLTSPTTSSSGSPQALAYSPSKLGRGSSLLNSQLSTYTSASASTPTSTAPTKSRKRSYDETAQEPAPKRHATMYHSLQLPLLSTGPPMQSVPQAHQAPAPLMPLYSVHSMPLNLAPQLPLPGTRAMATVYPSQQHPTSQPISMPPLQTNILPQPGMVRLDHSRGLSPYTLESAGSSPLSASVSQVTTPFNRLSPSFYLTQRSSPYKPIRRPHTLLAPPPPVAYHNPARAVSDEQMQYHSLGRPMGERQHGHIPYHPQPHQYYSPLPPLVHGSSRQ